MYLFSQLDDAITEKEKTFKDLRSSLEKEKERADEEKQKREELEETLNNMRKEMAAIMKKRTISGESDLQPLVSTISFL